MPDSPYVPDHVTLDEQGGANDSVTFDGSESDTDAAIISGIYGNVDCEIFIEASDDAGSTWEVVTQLGDDAGNHTFAGDFHSQFNRIMVTVGKRRLRIDNVDTVAGQVSVDGDQR